MGSTFYFIGSIYFIPAMNNFTLGTWLFIVGSAVIVVAQSSKLWRGVDGTPTLLVETGAGMGGFCFLVGSIYFLPGINTVTWRPFERSPRSHT